MTDNETPHPLTARQQIALMLSNQHEERMGRLLAPKEMSYSIQQKSPAGKTTGFEFEISGPDADEVERKALEWAEKFPAPQPVQK